MDAVPSTSALLSPPKKRKRLNLGHLSLAEKQCILNTYKQILVDEPSIRISDMVNKIVVAMGKTSNKNYCNIL